MKYFLFSICSKNVFTFCACVMCSIHQIDLYQWQIDEFIHLPCSVQCFGTANGNWREIGWVELHWISFIMANSLSLAVTVMHVVNEDFFFSSIWYHRLTGLVLIIKWKKANMWVDPTVLTYVLRIIQTGKKQINCVYIVRWTTFATYNPPTSKSSRTNTEYMFMRIWFLLVPSSLFSAHH